MIETSVHALRTVGVERTGHAGVRASGMAEFAEKIRKHFRDNYPILLDGALPHSSDQGHFIRQAREMLAKGRVDPELLPAAILRETLDAIQPAKPKASTKAGLVAIAPRRARVWWDQSALDGRDDILADLAKPRLVLRFYDVSDLDPGSGRWNNVFDIDVRLKDEGMSVDFWSADRSYVVELGLTHADGRFLRLARTNAAALPREGKGEAPTGQTVRSNLRPNPGRGRTLVAPDLAAREWAEIRPDRSDRDLEAELVVHMLYRSFLLEGPRALRHAPLVSRRDLLLLQREYAQRGRRRQRRAAVETLNLAPLLLVARLDAAKADEPVVVRHPPAPQPFAASVAARCAHGDFARLGQLFALSRRGGPIASIADACADARRSAAHPILPPLDLVQNVSEADHVISILSAPVFRAAESLRQRLAGLEPIAPPPAPAPAKKPPFRPRAGESGDTSRRLARAGVRISRMALTLEGRMRPGARLKVAGKMVRADVDGRFRLECVVSGRKTAIPVLADSAGVQARSLINVEWQRSAKALS